MPSGKSECIQMRMDEHKQNNILSTDITFTVSGVLIAPSIHRDVLPLCFFNRGAGSKVINIGFQQHELFSYFIVQSLGHPQIGASGSSS